MLIYIMIITFFKLTILEMSEITSKIKKHKMILMVKI